MNTDKLIQFFNSKLNNISELSSLDDYKNPKFATWWNTIMSTCERMGQSYKQRASRVNFHPAMTVMGADNRARYSDAYHRGLNSAEALIRSIIEELETWGFDQSGSNNDMPKGEKGSVVLNLTISQQQVQQISQNINLSQYDQETQEKVNGLLNELKKETKDKSKISDIIKWLADKGVDALIAILLASTHLT